MHLKKALSTLAVSLIVAILQAQPQTAEPARRIIFPSGNYGWKSLAVHDDFLYTYSAGKDSSAVDIYAVGPSSLRFVKSIECEGRLSGRPAFIGDTGYFCNGHSLAVCDITTPEHAEIVNSVAFGYPVKTAGEVYAAGEMLVLYGSDGTRLYDASDPFAPVLVDFLPELPVKAVSDKYCLIGETDSACRLYRISKNGFEKLDPIAIGGASTCVFVNGKTIYETDNSRTRIHDITDATKTSIVQGTNVCLHPVLAGIGGKRLYSAHGCDLEEWDIANPHKPKLLKTTTFPVGINEGLCVSGNRFFLIDQTTRAIAAYSSKSGKAEKEFESFFAPEVSEIIPDGDCIQLSYKTKISTGKLSLPISKQENPAYTRLSDNFTSFSKAQITKFKSPTDIPTARRTGAGKLNVGKFAFVRDADGRIEVTDTSAKATVALLAPADAGEVDGYRCFAITNGNVYAATDGAVDIFPLLSVTNSAAFDAKRQNEAASGKFQKFRSAERLISSAQNLEEKPQFGIIDTTESPRGTIAIAGKFAFLAWTMETAEDFNFMGVVSIDISKQDAPRIIDAIPLPSTPCSIIADPSTNIIYTADTLGITAMSFGTNGTMEIITDLPISDSELKGPQQLSFLSNGTLAAACGKEGLLTVEFPGKTNLAVVAVFESAGFARAIATSSNTVYLCDSTLGVTAFQCDAPEDAVKARTRPLRKGAATSAFCLNGRLYATSTETELTSISADSKLRLLGEYESAPNLRREIGTWPIAAVPFASQDNKKQYAAIALGEGGIDICEITDERKITKVSHLSSELFDAGLNFFSALQVADGKLYAVDRNNGLFIIDVADPANPKLISGLIIR